MRYLIRFLPVFIIAISFGYGVTADKLYQRYLSSIVSIRASSIKLLDCDTASSFMSISRSKDIVTQGLVVDVDGFIIAPSIIARAKGDITVVLDKKSYKAKVIGHDDLTGLSVLKVKSNGGHDYFRLNNSSNSSGAVGAHIAILGLDLNVSKPYIVQGIISSNSFNPNIGSQQLLTLNYGYSADLLMPSSSYILTDARVHSNLSGAPVVNMNGSLIGMQMTLLGKDGGLSSLVIPIQDLTLSYQQIKKHGKVSRASIGVEIAGLSYKEVDPKGMFTVPGMLYPKVMSVTKDSPAYEAGIKKGDVIFSFNNKDIHNGNIIKVISNTQPDKSYSISIWRDNKKVHLSIKPSLKIEKTCYNNSKSNMDRIKKDAIDVKYDKIVNGLKLLLVNNTKTREAFGINDAKIVGLAVVGIQDKSLHSVIPKGVIILNADSNKIDSIRDFENAINEVVKRDGTHINILLYNSGISSWLSLPILDKSKQKQAKNKN